MVSGFITNFQGHVIAKKYVVLAKVRHSQRINDNYLCTLHWVHGWIRECCSHIASVLVYSETWTRTKW